MQIRKMLAHDIEQILVIEGKCYGYPWSKNIFLDCIRVGYECCVMEADVIEAYGIMSIAADEAHILNICVDTELQSEGRGRKILQYFERTCLNKNVDTIFLEVRPSNGAALHLYKTSGFMEVGLRKAYYPGPTAREDALILAKTLVSQ